MTTLIVLSLACVVGAGALAVLVILLKRVAYQWFTTALDGIAGELR